MPNLNILVDKSLLIAVNVAASKADMTQRDFVIGVLAKAAGWTGEVGDGDGISGIRTPGGEEPARGSSKAVVREDFKGQGGIGRDGAGFGDEVKGVSIHRAIADGATSPFVQGTSLIPGQKCVVCGMGVYASHE